MAERVAAKGKQMQMPSRDFIAPSRNKMSHSTLPYPIKIWKTSTSYSYDYTTYHCSSGCFVSDTSTTCQSGGTSRTSKKSGIQRASGERKGGAEAREHG